MTNIKISGFYKAVWLIVFQCFMALNILGQVTDVVANPDSVDAQLDAYNAQRMEFEYMLKTRECATDIQALKTSFENELANIDSLLNALPLSKIPDAYAGKIILISPYKAGDECLFVAYPVKKYARGCLEAFYPDSVDWSVYGNFQVAVKENRLCLIQTNFSGFTQIDKIQNADVSEKSAADLLALIKRTTDLYKDVIGVTYDQYLAFEKKKNLSTLKEVVSVRVQFLNLCKERIKK